MLAPQYRLGPFEIVTSIGVGRDAPDGRFLMIKGGTAQNSSEAHVVLDRLSEVSARVPSK